MDDTFELLTLFEYVTFVALGGGLNIGEAPELSLVPLELFHLLICSKESKKDYEDAAREVVSNTKNGSS